MKHRKCSENIVSTPAQDGLWAMAGINLDASLQPLFLTHLDVAGDMGYEQCLDPLRMRRNPASKPIIVA